MKRFLRSHFKEFITNPHMAWWHFNNDVIYQQICDKVFADVDGLKDKHDFEVQLLPFLGEPVVSVKKDVFVPAEPNQSWGEEMHRKTLKALHAMPRVITDAVLTDDIVQCNLDFLVLGPDGKYILYKPIPKFLERITDKEGNIYRDILGEISLQHYMLKTHLKDLYSNNAKIIYLNHEYVKQGDTTKDFFATYDVTPLLRDVKQVKNQLEMMQEELVKDKKEFDGKYPYDGGEYISYFGHEPQKGTAWYLPKTWSRSTRQKIVVMGNPLLQEMTQAQFDEILTTVSDEHKQYLIDYWTKRQQGETVINIPAITEKLATLQFPLYFYDYETINPIIPIYDETKPCEYNVVQYSIHKIEKDALLEGGFDEAKIIHKQGIITNTDLSNKRIVEQLVEDLGTGDGTYIVWRKGFENERNDEIASKYPEYAELFAKVNANTFDLMDIFRDGLYFDRRFNGSSSLKNVLPVVTDLSYDDLLIKDGKTAATTLEHIAKDQLKIDALNDAIKNLLAYCERDTRAMVKIWEKVRGKLGES